MSINASRLVDAYMDQLRPMVDREVTARVAAEEQCEQWAASNAALAREIKRLQEEAEALRHKIGVRNVAPPSPYATWDEHDEHQAALLKGELEARRNADNYRPLSTRDDAWRMKFVRETWHVGRHE